MLVGMTEHVVCGRRHRLKMRDVVESVVVVMKEDMVVDMKDYVSPRQIPIDLVDAVNGVGKQCQIHDLGRVNPQHAIGRCGGGYRIWEVRVEMRPFHYDLRRCVFFDDVKLHLEINWGRLKFGVVNVRMAGYIIGQNAVLVVGGEKYHPI